MQVTTRVKAGPIAVNHNEPLVRDKGKRKGLKVKTHIKAGRVIATIPVGTEP